jgi:hypothetical protein
MWTPVKTVRATNPICAQIVAGFAASDKSEVPVAVGPALGRHHLLGASTARKSGGGGNPQRSRRGGVAAATTT